MKRLFIPILVLIALSAAAAFASDEGADADEAQPMGEGAHVCKALGIPTMRTYNGWSGWTRERAASEAYGKCYNDGNTRCTILDCL